MEKEQFPEGAARLLVLLMQARGEMQRPGGAGGGSAATWAGLSHPRTHR